MIRICYIYYDDRRYLFHIAQFKHCERKFWHEITVFF